MGADADVYVFDDQAYRALVVPLFRRLIQYGVGHPAFHEVIDAFRPRAGRILRCIRNDLRGLEPIDLDAHCTYLGDDLRWLAPRAGVAQRLGAPADEWQDRACRREACPASAACPCFIDDDGKQAGGLSYRFQTVVAETCLGRSQFVGRNFTVFDYLPVLERNQLDRDDELAQLLAALGMRGGVVGYGFGVTEGIHGWLSHEETAQLARRLAPLPLPSFEPTFDAMRRAATTDGAHDIEGWEWEEVSVAFVRTTAAIAAGLGRGILWGNDVLGVATSRA